MAAMQALMLRAASAAARWRSARPCTMACPPEPGYPMPAVWPEDWRCITRPGPAEIDSRDSQPQAAARYFRETDPTPGPEAERTTELPTASRGLVENRSQEN
jgi:hypothetical protein